MNKQNDVETFSLESDGFQCKMCDKLYVTKEFLNSHIQNNHTSLKYPNREMFKCRICGK